MPQSTIDQLVVLVLYTARGKRGFLGGDRQSVCVCLACLAKTILANEQPRNPTNRRLECVVRGQVNEANMSAQTMGSVVLTPPPHPPTSPHILAIGPRPPPPPPPPPPPGMCIKGERGGDFLTDTREVRCLKYCTMNPAPLSWHARPHKEIGSEPLPAAMLYIIQCSH